MQYLTDEQSVIVCGKIYEKMCIRDRYGSRSYVDENYADIYGNMFQIVDAKCMDDNMEELAAVSYTHLLIAFYFLIRYARGWYSGFLDSIIIVLK